MAVLAMQSAWLGCKYRGHRFGRPVRRFARNVDDHLCIGSEDAAFPEIDAVVRVVMLALPSFAYLFLAAGLVDGDLPFAVAPSVTTHKGQQRLVFGHAVGNREFAALGGPLEAGSHFKLGAL